VYRADEIYTNDPDVVGQIGGFFSPTLVMELMQCEKCGTDSPVHYCAVDGFDYYLCLCCSTEWDAVQDAQAPPSAESVGQSSAL